MVYVETINSSHFALWYQVWCCFWITWTKAPYYCNCVVWFISYTNWPCVRYAWNQLTVAVMTNIKWISVSSLWRMSLILEAFIYWHPREVIIVTNLSVRPVIVITSEWQKNHFLCQIAACRQYMYIHGVGNIFMISNNIFIVAFNIALSSLDTYWHDPIFLYELEKVLWKYPSVATISRLVIDQEISFNFWRAIIHNCVSIAIVGHFTNCSHAVVTFRYICFFFAHKTSYILEDKAQLCLISVIPRNQRYCHH